MKQPGLVRLEKTRLRWNPINVQKYLKEGWKEERDGCFSVVQKQLIQTETQAVLSEHQETLSSCEGDQALAQVAQGGGRVSIPGDRQKLSGHGPGQLALSGLAWTGCWNRWAPEVSYNLHHSAILWSFFILQTQFNINNYVRNHMTH